MRYQEVVLADDVNGCGDFIHSRHSGRDYQRPPGGFHSEKEAYVCQRSGGCLVTRRVEHFHEIDGLFVPTRSEPGDTPLLAVSIDCIVLVFTEFYSRAV